MTTGLKKSLVVLLLAVNIVICLATALSAFGGYFDPYKFRAIPAIAAMTFPLWIVVTPLLAAIDFFTFRKIAIVPAVTMVLCSGQFLNFCPVNIFGQSPAAPYEAEFTLLSYNTYQFAPYDTESAGDSIPNPTLQTIIETDADMACLVETRFPVVNKRLNITRAQVDSLKAEYPFITEAENASITILSKYGTEACQSPELENETAACLKFKVNINNRQVTVYTVHLQSIGLDREDKELYLELTEGNARHNIKKAKSQLLSKLSHAFKLRAAQARIIRDNIMADTAKNVIVCGDFNDISGCHAIRCLREAGLRDAYTDAGRGPDYTYRDNRFYFHIDHILYKGDIVPVEIKVLKKGASDHYPVFARFRFDNH